MLWYIKHFSPPREKGAHVHLHLEREESSWYNRDSAKMFKRMVFQSKNDKRNRKMIPIK